MTIDTMTTKQIVLLTLFLAALILAVGASLDGLALPIHLGDSPAPDMFTRYYPLGK